MFSALVKQPERKSELGRSYIRPEEDILCGQNLPSAQRLDDRSYLHPRISDLFSPDLIDAIKTARRGHPVHMFVREAPDSSGLKLLVLLGEAHLSPYWISRRGKDLCDKFEYCGIESVRQDDFLSARFLKSSFWVLRAALRYGERLSFGLLKSSLIDQVSTDQFVSTFELEAQHRPSRIEQLAQLTLGVMTHMVTTLPLGALVAAQILHRPMIALVGSGCALAVFGIQMVDLAVADIARVFGKNWPSTLQLAIGTGREHAFAESIEVFFKTHSTVCSALAITGRGHTQEFSNRVVENGWKPIDFVVPT